MLRNHLVFIILVSMLTVVNAEEESTNAVVDLSALIDVSSLVEKIADRQVVFVGEFHDQYQHHLNQLAIIKGLHARQSDLAIGLEFFFQPFQTVLDRYIAGEIEEQDLVRESEYFTRWRFDFRLYRPIFRYAREHGIPLIALNLESEITKQVGREGIESLSEALKQRLPREIDRENESYRKRIQAIFDSHPHMKGRDFEHFLEAQLLWDEGMAERAADWMNEHPGRQLVILAGIGHLIYGEGIPDRLSRRVSSTRAVVLNLSTLSDLDPGMADYLILADKQALPPSGKLGVMLDLSDDQPRVSGFVNDSGAADAGVEKNDRLLSIDGQPISSYADIRIALMDKAVGESVDLEVERERLILGVTAETFQVTLR